MRSIVDTRARMRADFLGSLALLVIVAFLPAVMTSDYWRGVIVVSMYFALLAISWNLLAGYAGQFSLAPTTFAMIGGYTTGLLAYHFGATAALGIAAAIVVAGVIGLLLAGIVMRLRGPYLALTTLSFAEIIRVVIANSIGITRGDLGLNVPGLFARRLTYYYVMLAVVTAIQTGIYWLLRGPGGLYLRAIRDDEVAASGRGVGTVRWKMYAFVLSAAIGGLAGALYGHFAQFVSPELGLVSQAGLVISMVVIGGLGSLGGPIAGALLVYVTSELLREAGGYQLIVFALVVIVFARFFRDGLWGLLRSGFERRLVVGDERTVAE
jgi:branched-chain amino acid transport system permease protein